MKVFDTRLRGVVVLTPRRIGDQRGFFCETYNKRQLADAGVAAEFVQDNISVSTAAGTLRGLHFQREPFAQAKLLYVARGAARDVVVDLRRSSETFGQYLSIILSEEAGNQLYVPAGFAHGFITLLPDTVFAYKVTEHLSVEHEAGIRFDDPALAIDWGQAPLVISDRDQGLPLFDPEAEYFP